MELAAQDINYQRDLYFTLGGSIKQHGLMPQPYTHFLQWLPHVD